MARDKLRWLVRGIEALSRDDIIELCGRLSPLTRMVMAAAMRLPDDVDEDEGEEEGDGA